MNMIKRKRLNFLIPAFFLSLALLVLISCSPEGHNDTEEPSNRKPPKLERQVHLGLTSTYEEVGHWSFDGHLLDASGELLHGIAKDASTKTETDITGQYEIDAKVGSHALHFDGSFYIDLVDTQSSVLNFSASDPFSISLWMKRGAAGNKIVIGRMSTNASDDDSSAGWAIHFKVDNKIRFKLRHNTQGNQLEVTAPAGAIPVDSSLTGDYYHYVATYDGLGNTDSVKIYINAVPQQTTVQNQLGGSIQTGVSTNIGARDNNQGAGGPFVGFLDEVYIFQGKLDATDVTCLYNYPDTCLSNAVLFWNQGDWNEKNWAPTTYPGLFVWNQDNWNEKNWSY